jgi:hypothetical protein
MLPFYLLCFSEFGQVLPKQAKIGMPRAFVCLFGVANEEFRRDRCGGSRTAMTGATVTVRSLQWPQVQNGLSWSFKKNGLSSILAAWQPFQQTSLRPQIQQQQFSLLSKVSWGRLEMKSTESKNKKHKKGTSQRKS